MKRTNVISIEEALRARQWTRLVAKVDSTGLFKFPLEDVQVVTDSDAAELNAPVLLGARALNAVNRLVAAFCLQQRPESYGQLLALWQYCWFLHHHRGDGEPDWVRSQLRVVEAHAPDFLPAVLALQAGDSAALRRLHDGPLSLAALAVRLNEAGELVMGRIGQDGE